MEIYYAKYWIQKLLDPHDSSLVDNPLEAHVSGIAYLNGADISILVLSDCPKPKIINELYVKISPASLN